MGSWTSQPDEMLSRFGKGEIVGNGESAIGEEPLDPVPAVGAEDEADLHLDSVREFESMANGVGHIRREGGEDILLLGVVQLDDMVCIRQHCCSVMRHTNCDMHQLQCATTMPSILDTCNNAGMLM